MKYQKLGEHVLQVRGISFKPDNIITKKKDGYVPVIRSNNITEEGFKESDLIYINKEFIRPEQFIKGGDLVLTASSGSKKTIGKNIQFDSDFNGSFGAFCKLVRPKKSIDSKYLYHFFKTRFFRDSIERIVQGANIANLKNEYIDNLKILLPPLDDQIRIATLLSKVENLISLRREQLKQLDELLKSVFLEMFGDPVRNEKGWDILPFHKVGHFVSGGTPSKKRADFWSGNFPWVSPKDMKVSKIKDAEDHIAESVFEETTLKRISLNHLLIVVRGMILLHSFPVAINTVEIAINQDMKAIKPINRLNVVYLQYCVIASKRKILKLITTAGHGTRKFDYNAMQKLYIPMPPIDRQNQFADISEMVEVIKLRYQQSLIEMENLYGVLSQKAFKGELDLSRVLHVEEGEAVN